MALPVAAGAGAAGAPGDPFRITDAYWTAGKPERTGVRPLLWDSAEWDATARESGLGPGGTTADLGCGWGALARLLVHAAGPGGRVHGFDLDVAAVGEARDRGAAAGLGRRLQFHVADAHAAADEGWAEAFNTIACQTVLGHQRDPAAAVAAWLGLLRPGGVFLAIEADRMAALASRQGDEVDPDPAARSADLEVARRVSDGVRRCGGGDPELGRRLAAVLTDAGLVAVGCRAVRVRLELVPGVEQAETAYGAWLAREWAAVLRGDEDDVLQSLHAAGGGDPAALDRWLHAERARCERLLARLRAGTLRRSESFGWTAAWGRLRPLVPRGRAAGDEGGAGPNRSISRGTRSPLR